MRHRCDNDAPTPKNRWLIVIRSPIALPNAWGQRLAGSVAGLIVIDRTRTGGVLYRPTRYWVRASISLCSVAHSSTVPPGGVELPNWAIEAESEYSTVPALKSSLASFPTAWLM